MGGGQECSSGIGNTPGGGSKGDVDTVNETLQPRLDSRPCNPRNAQEISLNLGYKATLIILLFL